MTEKRLTVEDFLHHLLGKLVGGEMEQRTAACEAMEGAIQQAIDEESIDVDPKGVAMTALVAVLAKHIVKVGTRDDIVSVQVCENGAQVMTGALDSFLEGEMRAAEARGLTIAVRWPKKTAADLRDSKGHTQPTGTDEIAFGSAAEAHRSGTEG